MLAIDTDTIDRRQGKDKSGILTARGGMRAIAETRAASAERLTREARAKQLTRYQLRDRDGRYVNMDLSGFCNEAKHGWIGFKHQLETVLRRHPELCACRVVDVLPPARPGVW